MPEDTCISLRKAFDGREEFNVTVLEAKQPACVCVFAAGRGGDPLRHSQFMQTLVGNGCTIVAPHFEMLPSPVPTGDELDARIRRLLFSIHEFAGSDLPLVGAGHSIGTVLLLVLAGGRARTFAGERITPVEKIEFSRLALFAPVADFFREPGALNSVEVPVRIWVGAEDSVTPPDHAHYLRGQLNPQAPADVRVDEEAGHFTFMDKPPPNTTESHPNRTTFLASLADAVGEYFMT